MVSSRYCWGSVLLLLELERQKRLGEPNVDGAPGRTKKGTKGEGRWVVIFPGISLRASLCGGSTKTHMCGK